MKATINANSIAESYLNVIIITYPDMETAVKARRLQKDGRRTSFFSIKK